MPVDSPFMANPPNLLRRWLPPVLIALLLLPPIQHPVRAAQAPTEDGLWYYEIGGAEPVSAPANPSVVSVTLGGAASLTWGHSCGKFDPTIAVTHTLNQIAAGADRMMNAMTNAATAAIAALPALILQRANPGLYDLFQNALLRAEATLELATKSCEQMEAEIAAGKNPYADLMPKLHQESRTLSADLRNLVSGATPLTLANLEEVTAPGTAISRQVIEAIRDMPTSEQGLIMTRLVAEIGTARTVEKALYARRLLLTGRQVPEVYATEVAREHAQRSIEELDREIDSLLFETRVRKEVVSDTVVTLLKRAAARRNASMSVPQTSPIDPRPLTNGRVR